MEEAIIQWDWSEKGEIKVAANLCEKWEQNATAREYTFYLRKGLKWSDGEEFNTDDVKFWYEVIFLYADIWPSPDNNYLDANGKLLTIQIIDKYTFKVTYGTTKALLPISIPKFTMGLPGGPSFAAPEHYMKKFHPKYIKPEEMDKIVKDQKASSWDQLWNDAKGDLQGTMAFWFKNADRPTLSAWKTKISPMTNQTSILFDRNPFYFKVDAAGNQLPYLDEIAHQLYDNAEVFNLWLISGKIDCQWRGGDAGNFTLYKENEKKGDYRVVRWRSATTSGFMPNINCPDEVLAKLFDTPKFRQALSISINRKEINDLIYNGLYAPRQASPVKGSPQYDADFEKKWAEYDVATANKLLDELGLAKQADGSRKRPDGKTLEVLIKTADAVGSLRLDECMQVAKYWTAVGVKATVKQMERSLYEEQTRNGDVEIGRWDVDRSAVVMADPGRYIGTMTDGPYSPLYANFYSKSPYKKLEPPADHPIKMWDLWDKCQVEPDEAKRNALFKQLIDIQKAAPYQIGTVGEVSSIVCHQEQLP